MYVITLIIFVIFPVKMTGLYSVYRAIPSVHLKSFGHIAFSTTACKLYATITI